MSESHLTREGSIVIIGATGAVGREALSILADMGVPADQIRAAASARSAGDRLPYASGHLIVTDADRETFQGAAAVILCADADTSRTLAPRALAAGATVIDNSSAFRMDDGVPLVVPEVNGDLLETEQPPRLIANPNCSTAILLAAIEPLRREFGLVAVDVATYQAVSGAGAAAVDELLTQTRDVLAGRPPSPRVFREPCAFNLFSHDSAVDPADGLNGEERKIIDESRKILGQPTLRITPTCVRVPVLRAHTQAITVTLAGGAGETAVREAYDRHAGPCGLRVIDDRAAGRFPTPRGATGIDPILVGRLRPDPGEPAEGGRPGRARRWCLLASGDQLRKGAALNAIQIADRLGLLPAPRQSLRESPPSAVLPSRT